jgi:hypothetical protein
MKAYVLVQAWLLLSGAVHLSGPLQSNPARLVIYRHREFGGSAYNIKINDKKWGTLPTNRYLQMDLPPGRVKIESAKDYFSENQVLWIEAQPGRTYYIKAVEEVDFLTRTLLIAPIGSEQAQRELRGIKPASSSPAN